MGMNSVAKKVIIALVALSVFAMPLGAVFAEQVVPPIPKSAGSEANGETTIKVPQTLDAGGCSPMIPWSFSVSKCIDSVFASLAVIALGISSWILQVAGMLLNASIYFSVIKMSAIVNDPNNTAISHTWKVIRDLGNMTFIFILLYAAIGTILNLPGVNMKQMVKNVIIAALLINFSMFITKVVIDASNIFTVSMYREISQLDGGRWDHTTFASNTRAGLSTTLSQAMGLSTIYSAEGAIAALKGPNGGTAAILIVGIAGSVFMIIAAFIFLAMAIMFAIRFAILLILIILSPVYFISYSLPSGMIKGYANEWMKTLLGQSLFAPVFMVMIWVVLMLLGVGGGGIPYSNLGAQGSGAASFSQLGELNMNEVLKENGPIGLLFRYLIAVAFLIFSFVVSKSIATQGSSYAKSWMDKGAGWAGTAMFGSGAHVGRRVIGSQASKEAAEFKDKAARYHGQKGLRAIVAKNYYKGLMKANEKIAKSSFDARASAVGSTLGAGKGTLFGIGGVKSGGFEAWKKERKDEKKDWDKQNKKLMLRDEINEGARIEPIISKAQEDLNRINPLVAAGTATPADIARKTEAENEIRTLEEGYNKARKAIQTLSDEEIKDDKLNREFLMRNVSSQKFAAYMRNADISDENKEKAAKARFDEMLKKVNDLETINGKVAGGTATPADLARKAVLDKEVKDSVSKLSTQDVEFIDGPYLEKSAFASNLQQGVVDSLTKADNATLTGDAKKKLSDARFAPTKQILTPGLPGYDPAKAVQTFLKLDAKTTAKLDLPLLTNPDVIELYQSKKLSEMAAEMDPAKKTALKAAIMAHVGPLVAPGAPTPSKPIKQLHEYFVRGQGRVLYP